MTPDEIQAVEYARRIVDATPELPHRLSRAVLSFSEANKRLLKRIREMVNSREMFVKQPHRRADHYLGIVGDCPGPHTDEQPEPVSRADLLDDIVSAGVPIERHVVFPLIDRILSRYTITRKAGA